MVVDPFWGDGRAFGRMVRLTAVEPVDIACGLKEWRQGGDRRDYSLWTAQ